MWPMLSKWDSSVHMVKIKFMVYIIKVYILPFIMVKSDNPKQSYAHLSYGVMKSMKINGEIGFESLGFIIVSIANLAKNHQTYTI